MQFRLRQEFLEPRLVLNGTGFEGNPYAPVLDLSGFGGQSATIGEVLTLDLYASGAVVTDLGADGNPSGDTIRLQLDPDDVNDPQNWSIGDYGGSPGAVPNWDSLVDAVLVDETT